MKGFWKKAFLGVCLLVLCAGMTVCAAEDKILKGIYIDQVDVSGMTRSEALDALEAYERLLGEQTLTVGIGKNTLETSMSAFDVEFSNEEVVDEALGVGRVGNIVRRYKDQKDLQHNGKVFPLSWKADAEKVQSFVDGKCTKFDQEAKNASLTREDGKFNFVPGQQGLVLDVNASAQIIMDYLTNGWTTENSDDVLELKTMITEPEGSAEELAHVKDLLGTYSTSFSTSSANRRKNVNSGADHIDGLVLYPGEEFSMHDTVTPFTEENGYAMAGSYLNGEVVDSMGGGICQVSSTLYNAVIRAELDVSERSPHSMIVHYVDVSGDAAIAGDYKDFKFINSTDYPIYIEAYTTSEKKLVFNIYGKETRDPNRTIKFESQIVEEIPQGTRLTDDASQPLGYKKVSAGDPGYKAEYYKVVYVDGKETERIRVNKSNYKPSSRVVTYGTAGDPVISENLRAAIALQDEALANANIAGIAP